MSFTELAIAEKKSIWSNRFPEDNINDDMKAGLLKSWETIGKPIPIFNLFIDRDIKKKMAKMEAKGSYNLAGKYIVYNSIVFVLLISSLL